MNTQTPPPPASTPQNAPKNAPKNTSAINAPSVILWLTALFIGIHLGSLLLPSERYLELLISFSFIPARYQITEFIPGDPYANWVTPISYAFLHGSWMHVLTNSFWMLAFGSALAWRFGTNRFLIFSALCAIAGAGAHYLAGPNSIIPTVGASAAISGHMAAVGRFAFTAQGPLSRFGRNRGADAFKSPAEPLANFFKNRSAVTFIGVWFVMNLAFGLGAGNIAGEDTMIAWQAHFGGFFAGLLLFPFLDPVRPPTQNNTGQTPPETPPHN
ncbi:MAG: rhomboid family intramembrane serine protease [Hyphomicrobiales bacterium]|nr:MAG: rhomboid family intramembrane serine protease [Hyphomicrobiales bacterium]